MKNPLDFITIWDHPTLALNYHKHKHKQSKNYNWRHIISVAIIVKQYWLWKSKLYFKNLVQRINHV